MRSAAARSIPAVKAISCYPTNTYFTGRDSSSSCLRLDEGVTRVCGIMPRPRSGKTHQSASITSELARMQPGGGFFFLGSFLWHFFLGRWLKGITDLGHCNTTLIRVSFYEWVSLLYFILWPTVIYFILEFPRIFLSAINCWPYRSLFYVNL